MKFCAIASGSSGNSYCVMSEKTILLIDCGISGKRIFDGLAEHGIDKEDVDAVFVTHEHQDHVKSLKVVTKKSGAIAYMSEGTWLSQSDKVLPERQRCVEDGKAITVGDITVVPFAVSHDAEEPLGYSFLCGGRQVSVLTDTGYVSETMLEAILDADLLVLEANHEVGILQYCRYPYSVKRRILSDHGHLCNEATAECISELYRRKEKPRRILLAHLSKDNNTPDLAQTTVSNLLEDEGIYLGDKLEMDVIARDEPGALFEV